VRNAGGSLGLDRMHIGRREECIEMAVDVKRLVRIEDLLIPAVR
jgi:hypothetical protein